ncbi:MAG: mechanosensitive ion channel [Actinopolymorphaceae bacterium]
MGIGQSFQNVLDRIIGFLPHLLGFLVLLIIGYIVAKLVAALVRKVLEKAGVDRRVEESHSSKYLQSVLAGTSPARALARVVFWLIFAFFLFAAIGALRIPSLTALMDQVVAYLPNVIAAILIFAVAAIVAGAASAAIGRLMGDTPTGKVAATVVPALVMVIAVFMILQQLRIAEQIVQIAFAATMGALALGLALAFGLGGRPVAQRMMEDAYRKTQEKKQQDRADAKIGRQRGEEHATTEGDHGERPGTPPPPATTTPRAGPRGETDEPPPRRP